MALKDRKPLLIGDEVVIKISHWFKNAYLTSNKFHMVSGVVISKEEYVRKYKSYKQLRAENIKNTTPIFIPSMNDGFLVTPEFLYKKKDTSCDANKTRKKSKMKMLDDMLLSMRTKLGKM